MTRGRPGDAPLVAHVIYRFDVGGLENGLVNLLNRMPAARFRHVIVSLTDHSDFRDRLKRDDVEVFDLHKPPGNSPRTLLALWRLFRRVRPDIVHTRNVAALDATVPAALAGVPVRIHGEHGRDVDDLDGTNTRRQLVRRLYRPFIHQYIAVSRDLAQYLQDKIMVPPSQIAQIMNGVDSSLFRPVGERRDEVPHPGFCGPEHFVIGTVGRMQQVKDQLTLARAFVRLVQIMPGAEQRLRLVMIGEGPLRERVRALLAEAGLEKLAWLPGKRDDVARIMRSFDLFVLPSLAEGISNTILEAMATGLPVLATAVGGNRELVREGETGTLVPRDDPERMASALRAYAVSAELCRRQGREARRAIETDFGMEAMVNGYMKIYDTWLAKSAGRKGS
ncbi:MAG TPA: TIGR03088 family PEP-CTERM/XrtA system glycosyltransferase [Burkholderiales bacterium]|nr:TIGR03088 family PEP-CTERM/XrtA system glycosyltransferase [Burkholderiales bacterium]